MLMKLYKPRAYIRDFMVFEYTLFFIRKKFIRKWGSNRQNLKKIVRKSRGSISKIKCFYRPKIGISSLLHSKCQRWNSNSSYSINNESVSHSSQFISVKVRKNLRKSQAQYLEMLRKLRLRQNNDFLIKKKRVLYANIEGNVRCS